MLASPHPTAAVSRAQPLADSHPNFWTRALGETVASLDMLRADDERFTPSVTMYFDDVCGDSECQDDSFALREVEQSSDTVKIGPGGSRESI
jgi:hypothetical protein